MDFEEMPPSLALERKHLDRLLRRITYLDKKVIELGAANKNTVYEIAERDAIKWAYNLALSAHRNNARFFNLLAHLFPHKEEK